MIKKYSLLLIVFFTAIMSGLSQTTIAIQDFDSTTPTWNYAISPATYNISSDYWAIRTTNNAPTGTDANFWAIRDLDNTNGGGSFEHTLTLANVSVAGYTGVTTSFRYYTIGFDGPDYMQYQIAYNGGAFGTPVALLKNTGAWTTVSISAPVGTTSVSLRMIAFQNGGSDYAGWDDFEVQGTSSTPVPTITASPSAITGLDYIFPGGPSAAQSYSLSAVDLSPAAGNITVTAPTNFSISKTLGGTYTNSLTYAYTGGTLAASDVFVRLNAGLPIGTYGPSNVTNAGGGATAQNVSVTGNVSAGGSGASDILSVPSSEIGFISSLINDPAPLNSTQGAQVWQFRVRDGGGTPDADILPTILTSFNITQYTGNAVTTWSDAIESVDLFYGSTWVAPGTVTANQIQFSGLSGPNVTIPDDTERIFSLRLSLKCPLGADAFDGEDFVFGITNANVNFSGAGSGKASFPTQFSTNGQNAINVLATDLVFTVQPINTGLNSTMTDVIVTAVDACGNTNTTFTGPISIVSTGTMTGDPITVNAVAGVATFTNIIVHTVLGTALELTASSSVFGIGSTNSDPFDITPVTVLDPGDLAILAINTNTGSGDEIAFVIFKTITAGTRIYLTDNGYERRYAGEWGGTEGVISITRNGPDLDAGTIIVIRSTTPNVTSGSQFDVYTCGVIDANWTKDAISGGSIGGFNLNGDDDIWIMQGGIWTNSTTHHSTYTGGNVLYGWTESGWDAAPGGPTGNTRRSTIYPGLECFNTIAPTGPGFVKFNDPDVAGDFMSTTNARLDWISLINTTANWDSYTNNTTYVAGGYDYLGNTVNCPALTVAASTYIDGKWTGNSDENWFNCSNWDTLEVPDETVDVIVSDNTFNHGAIIDGTATFASNYGNIARAHNLTIEGERVEIINSATSNVLEVHGDLAINDPVGVNQGFLDMSTANADDKIFLYGNWTNNVGESAFDEGNGTVDFIGTTDQIVTGGIPTPYISEEFYNVILNNDYNTSISSNLYMNGNLTIIAGNRLTVADSEYVYVNFDVTNNGEFFINDNGSLVQGDDSGSNIGAISMDREASVVRRDYVYWSSPVRNFNVDDISPGTPGAFIYRWNPTIANPSGSQGNWVIASGQTMAAGIGYIVRAPDGISASTTSHLTTTFDGASAVPFNGAVPITVSRGSLLGIDDNWNLVGNPYPSAIDAYTFLNDAANSELDGFVNIWTHGTPPSTSETSPFYDDFYSNYTAGDYIAYNGMGMSSGVGDVSIGAGQSFMVNVSETPGNFGTGSYPIEFNNAMRGIGANYDNTQFYRTSDKSTLARTPLTQEKHRIWLDLVSETRGTNRILVGYAEHATMDRDRLYDAIADVQGSQGFYSTINDTGFTIQGRALPFVETDVIPLGMQLVENGSYHIAIGAIDGLFETEGQPIYIRDNTTGFIHNLTESPYSFSADAGVIDDRFEIVFMPQSLSVDEYELANGLTIVELQDGSVKFTVADGLEIKNVKIYDTLGRLLYDLEGNSSTEIYNVSNLSQAAYIAQVTLSNDIVITKKAVKRN